MELNALIALHLGIGAVAGIIVTLVVCHVKKAKAKAPKALAKKKKK